MVNTTQTDSQPQATFLYYLKMYNSDKQQNKPPAGYPTETPTTWKQSRPTVKKKGDRGFLEGCLFALCCCWLCETCF